MKRDTKEGGKSEALRTVDAEVRSAKKGLDHLTWISGLLLLLVLAVPFASILANPKGRVVGDYLGDGPSAYYHFGYFAGRCWRDGIVPLWNPHIMLGIPFLGEGQAAVFHPLSFLFVFLEPGTAINWLAVTAFVLTGMFFWGYLRALGLGRPASWCGAVIWSFSSAMIPRISAGHLNILLTLISAPMILMFWERYRNGGGARHLAGIALGYGLMLLAFYPQLLYIFSLFFLCYVLIQSALAVAGGASTAQREGRAVFVLATFIALGIGVGAIQLLPSLDFVSQSFRREVTMEYCGTFSLAPENLLTLIAPKFFGSTLGSTSSRYWGRNMFWEMGVYLGTLPLLMAVAGAFTAPRRRSLALVTCAVVFLVLALGKHTCLFPVIYKFLPFFDMFRGSSKCATVTLFCLGVLSAYGFEALFGESDELKRRRARHCALAAGALLFLVCLALAIFLVRNAEAPGSNWERFVKWVWSSGEICVEPLTKDNRVLVRATSRGAAVTLGRTMALILLSVALISLTQQARRRKYAFLPPIALVLVDLLGTSLPLVTYSASIVQAPLVVNESRKTPCLPRILVPYNGMPNIAMSSGYASPFGLTGNTLKRYNDFINCLQGFNSKEVRAESLFTKFTPQFDVLGFEAIAFDPERVPEPLKHKKPIGVLGGKSLFLFEDFDRPHAFLAAAPKYFSRQEDALSYVLANHAKAWTEPAIERPGTFLPGRRVESIESVDFLSFTPNRLELEVRAEWPRELVFCGMFERNWKAKVNGVSAPIAFANYVFRAVRVPAGRSRVVFEYRPAAFYWGAILTAASLSVLLLVFAGAIYNRGGRAARFSLLWSRRRDARPEIEI